MKKVSRKEFLALAGVAGMSLVLAGCGETAEPAKTEEKKDDAAKTEAADTDTKASGDKTADLRFITGGESGTYYAFGSVISQHATNNTDIKVTALVGNGSQANVIAIEDGDAELAFCQSDVMAYAYAGTNLFAKDGAVDCFSTVAALYQETVQIVTCDPEIKTVADLKGKNVSIGSAGSGVYFNAIDVLAPTALPRRTSLPPTSRSVTPLTPSRTARSTLPSSLPALPPRPSPTSPRLRPLISSPWTRSTFPACSRPLSTTRLPPSRLAPMRASMRTSPLSL